MIILFVITCLSLKNCILCTVLDMFLLSYIGSINNIAIKYTILTKYR